jgi:hypothetical protein
MERVRVELIKKELLGFIKRGKQFTVINHLHDVIYETPDPKVHPWPPTLIFFEEIMDALKDSQSNL